jgi:hypothetical protein
VATSGRSCPLAWAVFESHRVTVEKAPDRAGREGRAMPRAQQIGQLDQDDVLLRLNRDQDHVVEGLDVVREGVTTLRINAE